MPSTAMVNLELMAFVAFLRQRQDLRQALSSVRTPYQIVAMAEEVGFAEQGGELVDTSGVGSQVEWLPSRDGDWRSRKTG